MSIITIDGNIGCGKTSILNHLHKFMKYPIDLEPVENWQKYLDEIYKENKNMFNFQVKIWLDRCWIQNTNIINDNTINKIFVERNPYFIKNCFIELSKNNNLITDTEYNTLLELHSKTDNIWKNYKKIYIRSRPEKCYNRILKRNRQSENNITLEYLKSIHEYHEKAVSKLKDDVIIINIDNNYETKTLASIVNEILEKIN